MIFKYLKSGYDKVKSAFVKTRSILGTKIRQLFSEKIDEAALEQLEQLLFEADLGVKTVQQLTHSLREYCRKHSQPTPEQLMQVLREELTAILKASVPHQDTISPIQGPKVILFIGVNGSGKTTSVAKLAKRFQSDGKKVLLTAADTFRAAATEQLEIWANRLQIEIVKGIPKSDPAAIAFDALTAAKARQTDIIIIDTAGRLHTKTPLMQELEKIKRTCSKVIPSSPHETFLVLDATIGQNAIDQAKVFHQYTPITGLILTKLDGTAKGGIIVNLQQQLGIPVKYIGIGEGIDDMEPFENEAFISSILD